MINPTTLLPLKVFAFVIQFGNSFEIHPLKWSDFPGQVDEKMTWSAHIYWSIDYKIMDY
jgi:hypothetical protein